MDTPPNHDEARSDKPADATDDKKPTSSQTQEEPRVVAEAPPENDAPTPDEPLTPSYTFDIQTALAAAQALEPSSTAVDDDELLYVDDRESTGNQVPKTASDKSSSPERVIESMAPRAPRPEQPHWRTTTEHCRRRSTGGLREEIFARNAN